MVHHVKDHAWIKPEHYQDLHPFVTLLVACHSLDSIGYVPFHGVRFSVGSVLHLYIVWFWNQCWSLQVHVCEKIQKIPKEYKDLYFLFSKNAMTIVANLYDVVYMTKSSSDLQYLEALQFFTIFIPFHKLIWNILCCTFCIWIVDGVSLEIWCL